MTHTSDKRLDNKLQYVALAAAIAPSCGVFSLVEWIPGCQHVSVGS